MCLYITIIVFALIIRGTKKEPRIISIVWVKKCITVNYSSHEME